MYEHLKESTSRGDDDVIELVGHANVYHVNRPMCKFNMMAKRR